MKKLFTVAVLMIGFTVASYAQQSTTSPKETRKEEQKKMKDELNLSNEQETKLKDTDKEFRTRAQSIKANTSLSEEQKKEQLKSLHKERVTKANAILTPEQQEKGIK